MKSATNTTDESHEEEQVFKVLEGRLKFMDYGNFCLLVPDSMASFLCEALQQAQYGQFDWSVCEDEEISIVENLPAALGHPIRSIRREDVPEGKSEPELLDWLIHGESFFSKQYVVLDVYRFGDCCRKVPYEITKPEHLKFFEICKTIRDAFSRNDFFYLLNISHKIISCNLIDRGRFFCEFPSKTKPIVVSDELLKEFEEFKDKCRPNTNARELAKSMLWFSKTMDASIEKASIPIIEDEEVLSALYEGSHSLLSTRKRLRM